MPATVLRTGGTCRLRSAVLPSGAAERRVVKNDTDATDPAPSTPESDPGSFAGAPRLVGHFAVFNRWTEIDSALEGRFMERIARGAFITTFARDRGPMRVLFQHGQDPQLGDKPLGPIETLREDDIGGWYEVPLLGTSYNAELEPGLRAGVYGSSFRFQVVREQVEQRPGTSSYNPEGLPERTIKEVKLAEISVVTFPAYGDATAGVRSLTDWYSKQVAA
jgi:HK97 family phage prohead protease